MKAFIHVWNKAYPLIFLELYEDGDVSHAAFIDENGKSHTVFDVSSDFPENEDENISTLFLDLKKAISFGVPKKEKAHVTKAQAKSIAFAEEYHSHETIIRTFLDETGKRSFTGSLTPLYALSLKQLMTALDAGYEIKPEPMTTSERLDAIRKTAKIDDSAADSDYHTLTIGYEDALWLLEQSEKQIVNEVTTTVPGGGNCPSCTMRLIGKANFCGECGQAIAWTVYDNQDN